MIKVAALFVEKGGVYFGLPSVEPWDESRDARTYDGPDPVVAHPPCHLWVNLAALNYKRWGGEHNRPGNDRGAFKSAVASVERCHGVLEHPAHSRAWERHGLKKPKLQGWNLAWRRLDGTQGWVCEVWQSAYGHKARKRTWLYYVGRRRPFELRWTRRAGSHQVGWFDRIKPTLNKKEANRTPSAFRDDLLTLARFSVAERGELDRVFHVFHVH